MKKIITVLICCLILSGCSHIEDTNGSDTALETMTMADLADESVSSTASGASTKTKRIIKTTVTEHEDIDNDETSLKYKKFSGVASILVVNMSEGEIVNLDISSEILSGNAAMAIITPSNDILYFVPFGNSQTYTIVAEENGMYFVRLGGESFEGSIDIKRTFE